MQDPVPGTARRGVSPLCSVRGSAAVRSPGFATNCPTGPVHMAVVAVTHTPSLSLPNTRTKALSGSLPPTPVAFIAHSTHPVDRNPRRVLITPVPGPSAAVVTPVGSRRSSRPSLLVRPPAGKTAAGDTAARHRFHFRGA